MNNSWSPRQKASKALLRGQDKSCTKVFPIVLNVISSTMVTDLVKGYALPDVGRKIAISSRLVALKKAWPML